MKWIIVFLVIGMFVFGLSIGMLYKAQSVYIHERTECYLMAERAGCIEIDWENERLIPKCIYFQPSEFTLNLSD